MRVGRFKFEAVFESGRWCPIGLAANGDDVFVDGCVISDRKLAERIAMNMEAAYNQGVEDASRDFIQNAVAACKKVGMLPAQAACSAGWLIDEPEETCHAASAAAGRPAIDSSENANQGDAS